MIAPLTSNKCQLNGRSIASAATLAILMSVAPHQASAKGGIETSGVACGGKRYRDPITHRCRGPADFGN